MWTKIPVKQRFTDNRTSATYAANIAKSNGIAKTNDTSKSIMSSKDSMISRTGDNIIVTNDTNLVKEGNTDIPAQSEYAFDNEVSQKKLTEAIIWSEILGKPLCKRRVRR